MTRVKQAMEIQITSKGIIVNNDHQFGRTEVTFNLYHADINDFLYLWFLKNKPEYSLIKARIKVIHVRETIRVCWGVQ